MDTGGTLAQQIRNLCNRPLLEIYETDQFRVSRFEVIKPSVKALAGLGLTLWCEILRDEGVQVFCRGLRSGSLATGVVDQRVPKHPIEPCHGALILDDPLALVECFYQTVLKYVLRGGFVAYTRTQEGEPTLSLTGDALHRR